VLLGQSAIGLDPRGAAVDEEVDVDEKAGA
jgi:hypothetical protein